jgi:UDP-N-acetylmuramoyl-L-alanyl-D-glutamate--2,6-diaminopimelate ligase
VKNLESLLGVIDYELISGTEDMEILSIEYDSRKCSPGCLFVAMRGTAADGHNFIEKAVVNGAVAVICEESPANIQLFSGVSFLKVSNSRASLARISHRWYDYPTKDMKIVGITGTNGKTTTTFLLKSIFEKAGLKCGIIGTTGIFIGEDFIPSTHTTPESLELAGYFDQMRDRGVQVVAIEISSHALHQHRADCIHFNVGVFTNLTHDHLDYHKTMEEYADAKKLLFDMLGAEAYALYCDESEYSGRIIKDTHAVKYSIGRKQTSDFRIFNEIMDLRSSEFILDMPDFYNNTEAIGGIVMKFQTLLPGKYNIDNSACAIAASLVLGISPEIIYEGLAESFGAPGRMQRVMLSNGALGIVDYAHTPDALDKALRACRELLQSAAFGGSRLLCVFGCGGDRDKTKRPEMGKISSEIADISVVTSDNPRTENPEDILDDIYKGIEESVKSRTVRIADRKEAIEYAVSISQKDDIILVAGKGHEDYQIIGTEKIHFDDVEQLCKYS